jgi:hypothetical protein
MLVRSIVKRTYRSRAIDQEGEFLDLPVQPLTPRAYSMSDGGSDEASLAFFWSPMWLATRD